MNFEAYVVRFSGTGKSKTAPYMGESLSGFGYVRMRIKVTHIGRRMRRPAPALVTKTAAQKDARQIKTPAKKVDNLPHLCRRTTALSVTIFYGAVTDLRMVNDLSFTTPEAGWFSGLGDNTTAAIRFSCPGSVLIRCKKLGT